MKTLNVLALCGSLRKGSFNMEMLRYAQSNTPEGMEIQIADLTLLPFYNADLDDRPAAVVTLFEQLEKADALLLGCPEYNYSLAPVLKNALDWASRETDNRLLSGKPAAMMGAGGGMGTARAQYQLRQVCVFLNLLLINKPEVFCNAFAGSFDEDGKLVDPRIQGLIKDQLGALLSWSQRLQ